MTEIESLTINKTASDAYIDVIMVILVVFNNEAEWGLQPTRTFKGRNNSQNVYHWIATPVTLRF